MNRTTLYALLIGGSLIGLWVILRMEDVTNLAKTIWGEARGEPRAGREAVAASIMNRVGAGKWFSGTVSQVVLKPWQFSVWNPNDPNRAKLEALTDKSPGFLEALEIATLAMRGKLVDRTGGATHYHTIQMTPPKWASSPGSIKTAVIGNHVFYKGVA